MSEILNSVILGLYRMPEGVTVRATESTLLIQFVKTVNELHLNPLYSLEHNMGGYLYINQLPTL